MTDPNDENIALKTDIEEQDIQSLEPDAISSPAQPRPPPPQRSLSRRESIKLNLVQYKDEVSKEKIACVATCLLLIVSAPAIAAVIIASGYNQASSACNDGTDYLIDPQTYLYVAGGVQLGMSALFFMTQIIAFLCFSESTWIKIKICLSGRICKCISACYPIWHLVWAGIGIYIYVAQMSDECQQEDIGIMILAWCIIQWTGICCITCCAIGFTILYIDLFGL
eukprot:414205_1